MKLLTNFCSIICGLLICFSLVQSQTSQSASSAKDKSKTGRVKTLYDKAKNETTVFLTPMTVRETPGTIEASFPADGTSRRLPSATLQMMPYFTYTGKTLITPKYAVIAFLSLSQDESKYASERELTVIVDGSRLVLGEMKVTDRRVDSGIQLGNVTFYRETLELPVMYNEFLRIAKATKVRVRLGKTEFDLSSNQMEALRTFARRMQG